MPAIHSLLNSLDQGPRNVSPRRQALPPAPVRCSISLALQGDLTASFLFDFLGDLFTLARVLHDREDGGARSASSSTTTLDQRGGELSSATTRRRPPGTRSRCSTLEFDPSSEWDNGVGQDSEDERSDDELGTVSSLESDREEGRHDSDGSQDESVRPLDFG
jgi:hypothetical protein